MNVAVRELQTLFEVGSLGSLSDGQLLNRFVERREEAVFEAIVHRHGPMVWGVCRRVLRDHHDAEDAFQATFLVLARKATSVMIREKLGNWLYGVAYQTATKARAMRARRRGREGQVLDMPEPVVMPEEMRDDLAEALDRELSRLPETYRIPIVLCELEGMSHKEAADQLGWPIGTVSSRLSRARSMLAKRLSRRGLSLSGGSLAVLLAQESASASLPTRLIGSTAQAASLFAAGGAAAGVVPAGVAALTKDVLKAMLVSKIKIISGTLLVASALAAGGTGLAYQAQTTEPGQEKNLKRLIDDKKEELQRLIDRQKREDRRTPLVLPDTAKGQPERQDPTVKRGRDEHPRDPQLPTLGQPVRPAPVLLDLSGRLITPIQFREATRGQVVEAALALLASCRYSRQPNEGQSDDWADIYLDAINKKCHFYMRLAKPYIIISVTGEKIVVSELLFVLRPDDALFIRSGDKAQRFAMYGNDQARRLQELLMGADAR